MAGAFVGLDGRGAEVWVQTGPGKIVALDDSRDKTAQVTVLGEGLKHKTHGWIPKTDPLFTKVKEAFDQKRDIEYRIESQRKATVDANTPIRELRPNMETAKENTIQIFAGMDGELSQEAVTNPRHDSAGGRVRASDEAPSAGGSTAGTTTLLAAISEAHNKNAPEGFVNALMAQAVAAGASVDEVIAASRGRSNPSASSNGSGATTRQAADKKTSAKEPSPVNTPEPEEEDTSIEVFTPVEDDATAERASEDTVSSLRALVVDAEITDMSLVSGILNYTFGTGVARNVSEENLGDFVDFYVANGAENFRAALAKVSKG